MHKSINNLISLQSELKTKFDDSRKLNIVAVSKTFKNEDILPLIHHGHKHFGENKVQEAVEKWSILKKEFPKINLHMIGKLQTNKVKFVVPLFDYIHSLDNVKLAEKISVEQKKNDKRLKIFIQINFENEEQKSGISPGNLEEFYNTCTSKLDLNIIGLMCIPPNDDKSVEYFSMMKMLKDKIKVSELSMGMSNDYLNAIKYEATFIRIGSKIFGRRSK